MQQPLFTDTFLDNVGIVCFWNDLQGRTQQTTQYYADLLGYNNKTECIGKRFEDHPCSALAKQADLFYQQEAKVIASGETVTVLNIHTYPNDTRKALLMTKSPLRNESGEIYGVLTQAVELNAMLTSCIYKGLNQSEDMPAANDASISAAVVDTFKELKLSKRESECLYYLLRGQTSAVIAEKLGIASGTVEAYISNIKTKTRCRKKSQVIEFCVERGYTHYIPASLLPEVVLAEA